MEATGELIRNKIADKITNLSRSSQQNNSEETFESETENSKVEREIPKERFIYPEKRQQIINDLRLI